MGFKRRLRLQPRRALELALGLLGLRMAPPALRVLGARVIEQPSVQAESPEEERERVEEGAREDEGVDGRVGEEVRRAEGAHQIVEREGVEAERGELIEQLGG